MATDFTDNRTISAGGGNTHPTNNLATPLLPNTEELLKALEDIVTYAAPDGTQDDGDFVGFYVMPTGKIHTAVTLLRALGSSAEPCGNPKNISRYQAFLKNERKI